MSSALFLAATTGICAAQDTQELRGAWFAGGMYEQDFSGYGGVTLALPGSRLGEGPAVRLTGYSSRYQYLSGTTMIDGTDTGGLVSAQYQLSGDWGWSNFGVGGRYIDTRLTPRDPGNTRSGSGFDAQFTTDGAWFAGNGLRADWYAGYGIDREDYQLRGGLTHAIVEDGRYALGIEAGAQGDPYYSRKAIGGLGIMRLDSGMEIRLSAGATFQSGRDDAGYVALAVAQPF